MKYTIYEDPLTHRFALLPLPDRFVEGDELPAVVTEQWFASHAEVIGALPGLLDRDESEPDGRLDESTPNADGRGPADEE